ncbi:alpha amylase [Flagelloscypha sp. PMI_526]|nr:alpha amylase [Flagelloscypha sp. PMI_526]
MLKLVQTSILFAFLALFASFLVPSPMATKEPSPKWWKEATVLQIYTASFLDTTGSGTGDLRGILRKLDYIKDLGIDVIWLNPIYTSPQADMGYDISDYRNVDPQYGSLEDWDELVKEVHKRGMKLIMDLVFNHSSDEHPWFQVSRASKNNPKRDWYIWRDPKINVSGQKEPPNNWQSHFQGSAWTYDDATAQYYLHLYLDKQPDLNWENPEVRDALKSVMKFWIARGCDGFHMDAINLISKVPGLPDAPVVNPESPYQPGGRYYVNGPKAHEYIKEIYNDVLSKHNNLMIVGEPSRTNDANALAQYVLPENKELQMMFQFAVLKTDKGPVPFSWQRPDTEHLGKVIQKWQRFKRLEGYWNAICTENHDQGRSVSRFGNDTDQWRTLSSKLLAVLQLTQSGTQFVYQGQELGVRNIPKSWGISEYKDISALNYYNKVLEERKTTTKTGKRVNMSDVMAGLQKKGRDNARLPMPWNSSTHGGFTTSKKPWMTAHEDYPLWNAELQINDSSSVLSFWKRVIAFRKTSPTLIYGSFNLLELEKGLQSTVMAYIRHWKGEKLLILLNFSETEVVVSKLTLDLNWQDAVVLLTNYEGLPYSDGGFKLRGWESLIVRAP